MMRFHALFLIVICASGCRDKATVGPVGTFSMGERAQVGPLIYTVFDTQSALTLGDPPAQRVPSNRFLLLKISVVNSGPESMSVPTFSLVDDEGKSYQEAANGEGVHDWLGFVRKIKPAESAQGTILFDVPQKRFKLRVADENDQKYAFVSIPLTLGEAPPDVVPGVSPGAK